MGLIEMISLKRYKTTCYFYQNIQCVLNKKICLFCNMRINQIEGVFEVKDYINIVNTRNMNRRALYISILSLFMSFLAIIINYLGYIKK